MGNGQRCDPLTVCDRHSHYVLACDARPNQQYGSTLHAFRGLMRYHGLPEIIRCDLGSPFASCGLGRFSSLSLWWLEQGIDVEFTRPASPQDNGSHERMHRDLKAEVTTPPSPTFAAQQRRFDRWQHGYNHERPHEALDQRCPAEFYHASDRRLAENDRPLVYPSDHTVKTVSTSGHLAVPHGSLVQGGLSPRPIKRPADLFVTSGHPTGRALVPTQARDATLAAGGRG